MDLPGPDKVIDSSTNLLKRKRELLPLGTPPLQSTPLSSSSDPRPVLRANRACNTCRRQKMRCDGADSYPCSRCKNSGVECVFEKMPPNKGQVVSTTSRIDSLEKKIMVIQETQFQMNVSIQEILHELQRSRPAVSPGPTMISGGNTLDPPKATSRYLATAEPSSSTFISMGAPRTSFSPEKTLETSQSFTSPPSLHPSLPPIQSLLTPSATPPGYPFASPSLLRTSISLKGDIPHAHFSSVGTSSRQATEQFSASISSAPGGAVDHRLLHASSNIAHTESTPGHNSITSHINEGTATEDGLAVSNRRPVEALHVLRDDSGNRVWNPDDYIKEFRTEDGILPDVIMKGLLDVNDAKGLFSLFFGRCHPRMPILDPKTDDFESLRRRSPFCFCCVLMVAAKARDGGNQPSALQLSLWEEAMSRAKHSMFHRVKDLEVIQGILLLSAWSESTGGTSWILAGHAIRCGVELGIHKSLGKLSNLANVEEDAAHLLVCSARVWCALFAFEHQLSLGIGRFTMIGSSKTVKNARETLLRHPLSTPDDMRLVSACEIMIMEYQILNSLPNPNVDDPNCQTILENGRARIDAWYSEWDGSFSALYSPEHYMRQSLDIYRCYGHMTIHLACMPRNIASADLANLSQVEKANCRRAVSAAKQVVKISVGKKSYREGLQYSPPCFSGGVSFVGALILRLGDVLLGEENHNLSLAEELSQVLRDVPTCRFKYSFLTLLEEHRRNSQSKLPELTSLHPKAGP